LNESFFVHAWSKLLEVDGGFDRFPEISNKAHVHVGLEKGGADLFYHAIEGLASLV
jgi:hypothetical protein